MANADIRMCSDMFINSLNANILRVKYLSTKVSAFIWFSDYLKMAAYGRNMLQICLILGLLE
jgi:hypothetical protein